MITTVPSTLRARPRGAGFSLIEIMIVVVIVGILSMAVLVNSSRGKGQAELSMMKTRAGGLVVAQSGFVSEMGRSQAATLWAGRSNEERYALVRPWLGMAPPTLNDYVTVGYTISFPDTPGGAVTLMRGSETIEYR